MILLNEKFQLASYKQPMNHAQFSVLPSNQNESNGSSGFKHKLW
jgi:hypothetical protein